MKSIRRLAAIASLSFVCAAPLIVWPATSFDQNLPSLGDADREELSPLMERKLGEQIMRDIRRDPDYIYDAPTLEYLNNFGDSLVAAHPEARGEAGFDFFFFVVRDPTLNAFALPGGFIGVHSALIEAAQSESELASVLAHEIGHVAQRHIARMLGKQRQDSLIPLASMVLAALTMHSSSDASAALMMGGQGLALQRQLSFSRNAEREADRIGLQILNAAHYDASGMVSFFARMQKATRSYSNAVPPFLLSHPLTTERIADIQARIRDQHYPERPDSLDFHLIRARLRVLQDSTPQGLLDAKTAFEEQLQKKMRPQIVAAKYGLALVALRQGVPAKAQALLQEAYVAAQGIPASQTAILENLAIDIKLAANQPVEALKEAESARSKFPLSRAVGRQYADVLIAAGHSDAAVTYLRDQIQLYRQEPQLQDLLAKAYAAQGKQALQHLALAEFYALNGSLPAALDQLGIARRAPDASFYDQAIIDARERDLKARWRDEMKEGQSSGQ